ncbi:zinc finger SWIM domain-containing protein 7 isoform X5 [Manihot esculenta]|uniref:zinc finger SWIM domain-containing protein 7 isoform X5 n=1 Tax=Manihot esculenta TaxID=3983 RepID=UPI000B5D5360|nr:zinc finger SWIM domain-containing protein 7 isoform X5 [Manihot esculenta]
MSASSLVAESLWKTIESTLTGLILFYWWLVAVTEDQLSMLVVAESQRKEEYFCFPEQYCACYSFFYDIVNRGEQLCCKHQLAARLAAALGTCVNVRVSDEQLALLLVKL